MVFCCSIAMLSAVNVLAAVHAGCCCWLRERGDSHRYCLGTRPRESNAFLEAHINGSTPLSRPSCSIARSHAKPSSGSRYRPVLLAELAGTSVHTGTCWLTAVLTERAVCRCTARVCIDTLRARHELADRQPFDTWRHAAADRPGDQTHDIAIRMPVARNWICPARDWMRARAIHAALITIAPTPEMAVASRIHPRHIPAQRPVAKGRREQASANLDLPTAVRVRLRALRRCAAPTPQLVVPNSMLCRFCCCCCIYRAAPELRSLEIDCFAESHG